jgi:hypothetical protein
MNQCNNKIPESSVPLFCDTEDSSKCAFPFLPNHLLAQPLMFNSGDIAFFMSVAKEGSK